MATYMNQLVTPPPLRPPTMGLFASAIEVNDPDQHLTNGATWFQEPVGQPVTYDASCGATNTLNPGAQSATRESRAMLAVVEDECMPAAGLDLYARAERHLKAVEQWSAEQEFWTGTMQRAAGIQGNGQFLTDSHAVDASVYEQVGGTGQIKAPVQALGLLEDYLGDALNGAQGMIHCTPTVANWWYDRQLLYRSGNITRTRARDTIVVIGAGYDGSDLNHHTSPRYQYAYATDLVWFWRGDILVTGTDDSQSLNRTTNLLQYRAERPIVVGFDGKAQAGVHIDPCVDPCTTTGTGS